MPFIFTGDDETYRFICQRVGEHFCLVWAPDDIQSLLNASNPMSFLKQLIMKRFGLGMLHPFDHHHPISDCSFLGRRDVLQRIRANPRTNFALVGPSKIGKTSLVQRYLRPSHLNRSLRLRQFYVDLYTLPPTDHALARAVRMAVDASASAYYDEPENLANFLEKARLRFGTLELIMDEADKHCHLDTMRRLIHLAQRDVCRLILVGRWRLMKEAVHTRDDNFSRLEPLVLEPLAMEEAISLLERPLTDLGLKLGTVRHELRTVINRLGRVPGHIQEFGCMLIEEITGNAAELTSDHIRRALSRVITSSRLVGLLDDLSSSSARAAALIMAMYAPAGGETDPLWLREEFSKFGILMRARDCMEVCDELVIHHLLGYQNGVYRIVRWDFVAEGQVERRRFLACLDDELIAVRRQQAS
ncbi:MAG: ATP-binding protein [Verrucomicrobia bacterium]|nr:ATP-binding protein [Verrucomicrobiota bacterium]